MSLYPFEIVFGPLSEREEAIARLGIQCGRQGCSLVLREHAARIETERKEYEAAVIRGAASWLDSLWAEGQD